MILLEKSGEDDGNENSIEEKEGKIVDSMEDEMKLYGCIYQ